MDVSSGSWHLVPIESICMTTHHPIAGSKFSNATLRRLAKKNIFLVSATWITGADGSFANGESAFLLSDGTLRSFLEVLAIAK